MNNDRPQGDSISREALKKEYALLMWREHKPYDTVKVCDIVNQTLDFIDNAPIVSDRYDEGYAQGYIDGSTGADWKGGAEDEL